MFTEVKTQLLRDPHYELLTAVGLHEGTSPQFLEAWRKCHPQRAAYLAATSFDEYSNLLHYVSLPLVGYKLVRSCYTLLFSSSVVKH